MEMEMETDRLYHLISEMAWTEAYIKMLSYLETLWIDGQDDTRDECLKHLHRIAEITDHR